MCRFPAPLGRSFLVAPWKILSLPNWEGPAFNHQERELLDCPHLSLANSSSSITAWLFNACNSQAYKRQPLNSIDQQWQSKCWDFATADPTVRTISGARVPRIPNRGSNGADLRSVGSKCLIQPHGSFNSSIIKCECNSSYYLSNEGCRHVCISLCSDMCRHASWLCTQPQHQFLQLSFQQRHGSRINIPLLCRVRS